MIYFDHNATAPMLPEARQAWLEAAEKFIGNPSSPHRIGSRADAALSDARERLASFLGCDALDIVWTSGATEASNMVLHHFAQLAPAQSEAWISAIEHPCVLETAKSYFSKRLLLIPAHRSGVINIHWIRERLAHSRPAFIALMAANNETGVLQPWREALALCRESGVPLFCDATQWIGKLPATGLGECDFVSGSAHKFGGPKGVGFLKCPAKGRVEPLLYGGKQEEGRRAGTENVAGVLSMVAALEIREVTMRRTREDGDLKMENRGLTQSSSSSSAFSCSPVFGSSALTQRLNWREQFERQLLSSLPGAAIIGAEAPRIWHTISALMPEADCQQRWVVKLDKLGFAVSTGSACASGREEPSHVLRAMGHSTADTSRVLRFSSGWETREEDWDALLAALAKLSRRS